MKSWGWVGPAFLWNLNYGVTNPGTELAQWGIVGRPVYGAQVYPREQYYGDRGYAPQYAPRGYYQPRQRYYTYQD